MSDRRAEDYPIKFGPIWMRNLSREGSAGATTATGSAGTTAKANPGGGGASGGPKSQNQNPPGSTAYKPHPQKHKLAQYRYGREEMLALYDSEYEAPTGISNVEPLYVPQAQTPLALQTDPLDDEPRDGRGLGLNRNLGPGGTGPGQVDRFYMSRGVSDAGRGRPRSTYTLATNGRATSRDDGQYGEPPAPGAPRSWSTGPHATSRNGDGEWSGRGGYYKSGSSRWTTDSNWRRPNSAGRFDDTENASGLRRLQPLGRPRPTIDRKDGKVERPTSWNPNRRTWTGEPQFSDDHLPEWATEGNNETGGTFDSSGAFHGVESPVASPQYVGLSRSHTQGSINVRLRSHDDENRPATSEGTQPWWNDKKPPGQQPKFDSTNIGFKKPEKDETANEDKKDEEASAQPKDDDKKKKVVRIEEPPRREKSPPTSRTSANDALRRVREMEKEINKQKGQGGGTSDYNSVLLTQNNTLRQKHQNLIPASEAASVETKSCLKQAKKSDTELVDLSLNEAPKSNPALTPTSQPQESRNYLPFNSIHPSTSGSLGAFSTAAPPETKTSSDLGVNVSTAREPNTWYYEDPQKRLQGPFTSFEMAQWYNAGFFNSNLMIRRDCDTQMRPLGSYEMPPFLTPELLSMPRDPLMMRFEAQDMPNPVIQMRQITPQMQPNMQPSLPEPLLSHTVRMVHAGEPTVMPNSGLPGMPGSGMPGSGMPGSGMPGSGMPGSGMPGSGMPGSGMPGSGISNASVPGSFSQGGVHSQNIPFSSEMLNQTSFVSSVMQLQDRDIPPYRPDPNVDYRPDVAMLEALLARHRTPVRPHPTPDMGMSLANQQPSSAFLMEPMIQQIRPVESLWQSNSYWMPTKENQWNVQQAPALPDSPEPVVQPNASELEHQTELLRAMLARTNIVDDLQPEKTAAPIPAASDNLSSATLCDSVPATVADVVASVITEKAPKDPTPLQVEEPLPGTVSPELQPSADQSLVTSAKTSQPASVDKTAKPKEVATKTKAKAKEEKKKKDAKSEMKIEDVPGFVKVKKEDKKKEEKKNEIKEIPAATKASQRAALEKKKTQERLQEEMEQKRKEEALKTQASEEDLLDKLEATYNLERSRQAAAASAAKKAPWCAAAPSSAATNNDGLTLAEIQRLEREKKLESIKEQQQMFQLLAQQQQAAMAREQEINQSGYNWTNKLKTQKHNDNVQSLAEIQEETRRKQMMAALEEQSRAPPPPQAAPQSTVTQAPWANTYAASGAYGGFWEAEVKAKEAKSPAHKPSDQAKPKKPKPVKEAPPKEEKKKPSSPVGEFDSWCSVVLTPFASQIDVPVFVSFLKDIESPFEVREYVKCYLGETRESTDFAKNFLEKRSKLLRSASASHVDDLCSPAPAKNPVPNNSDYQEVKGKGKKVKKNKMLKIDSRILGFSVTASEDRINVGDIETVPYAPQGRI